MADWYYIGHYGQLGPLTQKQMLDLIESNVIERTTFVWTVGLSEWKEAESIEEFADIFSQVPPPLPNSNQNNSFNELPIITQANQLNDANPPPFSSSLYSNAMQNSTKSDKSRIIAGIINIFIPGVGRMYLGYWAIGIFQLLLCVTGIGYLWSFIDGYLMLAGNLKVDALGREFKN